MSVEYREYIQSKEWKAKAKAAKRRVNYYCEKCGILKSEHLLHAHHLTYERLGKERKEDIMVLCANCHAGEHGKKPARPLTYAEQLARLMKA